MKFYIIFAYIIAFIYLPHIAIPASIVYGLVYLINNPVTEN